MPYLGVWCPECKTDTLPRDKDGLCLWCRTVVVEQPAWDDLPPILNQRAKEAGER